MQHAQLCRAAGQTVSEFHHGMADRACIASKLGQTSMMFGLHKTIALYVVPLEPFRIKE